MFRDDAKAFASDALAVELAKEALSDWDEFSVQERSFVVMPFMHSESLAVHDWAAKWFDDQDLSVGRNTNSCTVKLLSASDDTHTEIVCLEELQLLKKKPSYKNIQDFKQKSLRALFYCPNNHS